MTLAHAKRLKPGQLITLKTACAAAYNQDPVLSFKALHTFKDRSKARIQASDDQGMVAFYLLADFKQE